jgi:hypothetical protein
MQSARFVHAFRLLPAVVIAALAGGCGGPGAASPTDPVVSGKIREAHKGIHQQARASSDKSKQEQQDRQAAGHRRGRGGR